MTKGTKYKRQVLKVNMDSELAFGGHILDAEILRYSKRVTHISMYTKNGLEITFKNCNLFEPLMINDQVVYPSSFDTSLLYPIPGNDCEVHQEVNIPLQNGARIKGRFTNTDNAHALIIVLQLETI